MCRHEMIQFVEGDYYIQCAICGTRWEKRPDQAKWSSTTVTEMLARSKQKWRADYPDQIRHLR